MTLLIAAQASAQRFSVRQISTDDGLSNSCVVSICQDKAGYIWIATEEGLNRFDGISFQRFLKGNSGNTLSGNELNCIIDDPHDSVLWIATQRAGLNSFNYNTGKFTVYLPQDNMPDGISSEAITELSPSKDGNIWIASYWGSIDYYDKKTGKFTHYNKQTIPDWIDAHIWTVTENYRNARIYIGYSDNGLAYYDTNKHIFKNFRNTEDNPNTLPSNEILSVLADSLGRVWAGTRQGLVRFDEKTETFVRLDTIAAIAHKAVFDIRLSPNNNLWLALELGGIAIIDLDDNYKCTVIREGDNGLSGNSVRCIAFDKYSNIWAGIWNGGVNFLNPQGNMFSNLNNPECKSILSCCTDRMGRLYAGTDGGGVCIFDKGKLAKVFREQEGGLPSGFVQAAFIDHYGTLWLGMYKSGLVYYDEKSKSFKKILPSDMANADVRDIVALDSNNLLIASDQGIMQIDTYGKKLSTCHRLPHGDIRCLHQDNTGNTWAGTFGGGLFVLDTAFQVTRHYNTKRKFPSNTINHIIEDSEGRIWIATGEGLVMYSNYSDTTYQTYGKPQGLENTHIRAIIEDASRNIWISTNNGISCLLHDGGVRNFGAHYGIPSAGFSAGAVSEMPDGKKVFGSVQGLTVFYPNEVLECKDAPAARIGNIKIYIADGKNNTERMFPIAGQQAITLRPHENNFSFSFYTDHYYFAPIVQYACKLDGLDNGFYPVNDAENVMFRNVPPGRYILKVKTRFFSSDFSDQTTDLYITVMPPWYKTLTAKILYVLTTIAIIILSFKAYKQRVNIRAQLKTEKESRERQAALNEERMRFYTNIAHEIRTPLSLIIGPIEDLTSDRSLPKPVNEKLMLINSSSHKLMKLINNLLDFRKTETDKMTLKLTDGNLYETVKSETYKYATLGTKQGIVISFESDGNDDDFRMPFDRECIATILDNLISNSLKYTEKGFIKISLTRSQQFAVIAVEDSGCGISPEALPRVFDRYYQEKGAHQASGTGIGLSLVKNLITLLGGRIEAQSKLGEGSKFSVYIPGLATEQPAASPTPGKTTILVVEDNADIQNYIAISLKDTYRILSANNGAIGVETAIKEMPDIIISDIMMPVKNGIDLCKELKSNILTSHIPIILLTAKNGIEDKTEGYVAGADSYLTKPFSATLLYTRIENLLETKRRMKAFFAKSTTKADKKEQENKREAFIESLNAIDAEFLQKVDSIVKEQMGDPDFSVSTLSNILAMSTSTLYRKIKALTGITSTDYIRKIKMQNAAKMLQSGRYSVSEVSFKVGISSDNYFRQCFKDEYGVTPAEYVKTGGGE
ncbi:MAG: response regulator [Bacteroidales bacterium]|nr:response regulator [Bacteroidales bacterium]